MPPILYRQADEPGTVLDSFTDDRSPQSVASAEKIPGDQLNAIVNAVDAEIRRGGHVKPQHREQAINFAINKILEQNAKAAAEESRLASEERVGAAKAFGREALDTAAFGYGPEIISKLRGLADPRTSAEILLEERASLEEGGEQYPTASKFGTTAGIGAGFLVPGGLIGRIATGVRAASKLKTAQQIARHLANAGYLSRISTALAGLVARAGVQNPKLPPEATAEESLTARGKNIAETLTSPLSLGLGVALPTVIGGRGVAHRRKNAEFVAFDALGGTKKAYDNISQTLKSKIGRMLLDNKIVTTFSSRGNILERLTERVRESGRRIQKEFDRMDSGVKQSGKYIGYDDVVNDAIDAASQKIGNVEGRERILKRLEKFLRGEATWGTNVVPRKVGEKTVTIPGKTVYGKPVDGGLAGRTPDKIIPDEVVKVPMMQTSALPSDLQKIEAGLKRQVNYSKKPGTWTAGQDATEAARKHISTKVGGMSPGLRRADKDYFLAKKSHDIMLDKVSRERAKMEVSPRDWAGSGIFAFISGGSSPVTKAAAAGAGIAGTKLVSQFAAPVRAKFWDQLSKAQKHIDPAMLSLYAADMTPDMPPELSSYFKRE